MWNEMFNIFRGVAKEILEKPKGVGWKSKVGGGVGGTNYNKRNEHMLNLKDKNEENFSKLIWWRNKR